MKIPNGPAGVPTVSASQIRTYGAAGFELDEQEDDKGCPHLYWAKYVRPEPLPKQPKSYPLAYGSMFHDVLYRLEEQQLDPDEALRAAWDPELGLEAFEEARADLEAYLSRGALPRDRYLTLAVEIEIDAVLFVDPETGEEIRYRGILDWLGMDPEDPNTLHVVDFKTNRAPISAAQIYGDAQMRGQTWLVKQNSHLWVNGPVNVVTHLDGVKFREVEARFTDAQLDDWRDWMIAVVSAIRADEEHKPVLNPNCAFCPIRSECPAFAAMPETALALNAAKPADLEGKLEWRNRANRMRLILEKAVKQVDEELVELAEHDKGLVIGKTVWEQQIEWLTTVDVRRMHQILGARFYDAVSVTKAAVQRLGLDPSTFDAVMNCFGSVPNGTKYKKKEM